MLKTRKKNFFFVTLISNLIPLCALPANAQQAEELPKRADQKRYNITISDSPPCVWYRVAKAGTRSILKVLKENTKLSIDNYNIIINPQRYQAYFKFAFVRNPWDRVVSAYCNKVVTKSHLPFEECYDKSFDYFVDYIKRQDLSKADAHIRLQTELFPVDGVDFIGRFENFSADFQLVLRVLGIENIIIPHINASTHDHYSYYYTEKTRNIIAAKYKKDIDTFSYAYLD